MLLFLPRPCTVLLSQDIPLEWPGIEGMLLLPGPARCSGQGIFPQSGLGWGGCCCSSPRPARCSCPGISHLERGDAAPPQTPQWSPQSRQSRWRIEDEGMSFFPHAGNPGEVFLACLSLGNWEKRSEHHPGCPQLSPHSAFLRPPKPK